MWMALLFSDERLVAAAPACDQKPFGDAYWIEMHPIQISILENLETSYVNVDDSTLQRQLLKLGIDDKVNGEWLLQQIESANLTGYRRGRAA